MKIVALGGAGLMGRIAVKDLAASEGVSQVVIADRDTDLAHKVADLVPQGRDKISVVYTDVTDPDALAQELTDLRKRLLADPYFTDVPSMKLDAGKTAEAFHAKDDVPEVRREVLGLLQRHELRFLAVVRDKLRLVADVRELNRWNDRYRYNPNDLYDDMVKRVEARQPTALDPYAASAPEEFFAVVSEAFFEIPEVLFAAYPEVYRQLALFYRWEGLGRGWG